VSKKRKNIILAWRPCWGENSIIAFIRIVFFVVHHHSLLRMGYSIIWIILLKLTIQKLTSKLICFLHSTLLVSVLFFKPYFKPSKNLYVEKLSLLTKFTFRQVSLLSINTKFPLSKLERI